MKVLPVVERELRVASRRAKTYRGRWVAALIAVALGSWLYWVFARMGTPRTAGGQVYALLVQVCFFFGLGTGLRATSDCLSAEKREGTLGLLFLTHLQSYDIVLGKLLATSLESIYGLIAMIPVFFLLALVGGVTGGQLLLLSAVLGNTLFFSLSAGLLVSAMSRDARKASTAASLLVLVWWLGFLALGQWVVLRTPFPEWGQWILLFSPGYAANALMTPILPRGFAGSLAITHVTAWMFLALACVILPRTWREKESMEPRRWGRWWRREDRREQRLEFSSGRARRNRQLDINPFFWLVARQRGRVWRTWCLVLGVIAASVGLGWWFRNVFPWVAVCLYTAVLLHAVCKIDFCAAASQQMAEDRHSGALELLLSTPLRLREIFRGQWRALRQHYLGPCLVVLVVDLGLLLAVAFSPDAPWGETVSGRPEWGKTLLVFLIVQVVQFFDLIALGWLGMWTGLKSRHPSQSSGSATFFVLIVPWLLILAGFTWTEMATRMSSRFWSFWTFLLIWAGLGLWTDAVAIAWGVRCLYTRFRQVATERFQPPRARLACLKSVWPV